MRNTYPWKELLDRGRQREWRWFLPPELVNVPARVESRVRLKAHPDLRADDGRLEPRAVQKYTDSEGVERATIWLRFIPFGTDAPRGRMEHSADGRTT